MIHGIRNFKRLVSQFREEKRKLIRLLLNSRRISNLLDQLLLRISFRME